MSKKNTLRVAAVLAIGALTLGVAGRAEATVTITIGNVSVPAGSQAIVGVFATSNANEILTGYNLPLDINNDGLQATLPTGFTVGTPAFQNADYGNFALNTPAVIQFIQVDEVATGTGGNIQLGASPTKLFELLFNVGPAVPVGTVMPLRIIAPDVPFVANFNVAGTSGSLPVASPIIGAPALGSITVVPEPATAAALLIPAVAFLRRRRTNA